MQRMRILLIAVIASVFFSVSTSSVYADVSNEVNSSQANQAILQGVKLNLTSADLVVSGSTVRDACQNALLAAQAALSLAVGVCISQGWGSEACTAAVGQANYLATNALGICSEGPAPEDPEQSFYKREFLSGRHG